MRRVGERRRPCQVAHVVAQRAVGHLVVRPLLARPAEVGHRRPGGVQPVDLLVVAPSDVGDEHVAGGRVDGVAVRVAEAVGDDVVVIGGRPADQGVARCRRAGVRVEAHDGAVPALRIARRQQVLGTERTTFALGGARPGNVPGGVPARVLGREVRRRAPRPALLPVVRVGPEPAFSAAGQERPVRQELQVADRMARVLVAPTVLRQGALLAGGHAVDAEREADDPGAADASVDPGPGRGRTPVAPLPGRVRGVGDVDVGPCRELRIDGQAQDAVVAPGPDLGGDVGRQGRRAVVDRVEGEDLPVLLGDPHAPVRGELDVGRQEEAAEHGVRQPGGLPGGVRQRRPGWQGRPGRRPRDACGQVQCHDEHHQNGPPGDLHAHLPRQRRCCATPSSPRGD